ncbi:unnamed protein product [Mycetohabitans rhizoxinica HKI 454]|uniref:Uncharacterized protein n=2 Tax=Burkholderiaceae TaxID=119060 RepID=E5AQ07_MYCRK|nr:unnamed protein product [Mycetohabitans rhizoxinica HKI 454]
MSTSHPLTPNRATQFIFRSKSLRFEFLQIWQPSSMQSTIHNSSSAIGRFGATDNQQWANKSTGPSSANTPAKPSEMAVRIAFELKKRRSNLGSDSSSESSSILDTHIATKQYAPVNLRGNANAASPASSSGSEWDADDENIATSDSIVSLRPISVQQDLHRAAEAAQDPRADSPIKKDEQSGISDTRLQQTVPPSSQKKRLISGIDKDKFEAATKNMFRLNTPPQLFKSSQASAGGQDTRNKIKVVEQHSEAEPFSPNLRTEIQKQKEVIEKLKKELADLKEASNEIKSTSIKARSPNPSPTLSTPELPEPPQSLHAESIRSSMEHRSYEPWNPTPLPTAKRPGRLKRLFGKLRLTQIAQATQVDTGHSPFKLEKVDTRTNATIKSNKSTKSTLSTRTIEGMKNLKRKFSLRRQKSSTAHQSATA